MKTTGEHLGNHIDQLEKLARKLKINPLSYFNSLSHDEELLKKLENYDGDPQDIIAENPPLELWFEPSEALKTIEALHTHLQKHPDQHLDGVLEDLEDLKVALEKAAQQKSKFQIEIS
ncbi:hypothetical protein IT411_02320 [Candidatus Peregrinibacteria bacterium]|nr:hypothetical protein [Candidatus Peregrinibacteria bacterium]